MPVQTSIDIGQLQTEVHEIYIPFVYTNQGNRKEYILKVEPGSDVIHYLKPRTAILPGGSDTLRIYYDPAHKGNFSEGINVYVSSSTSPVHLTISGYLARVSTDPTLQCYDFKRTTSTKHALDKTIIATVRDSATHAPLAHAQVNVSSLSGMSGTALTDKTGRISLVVSPDQYTFYAKATGYKPQKMAIYLNHNSADIYIDLASIKETVAPIPTQSFAAMRATKTPLPDTIHEITIAPINLNDTMHHIEYSGELDPDLYKANNIVFLIDVSGSMGYQHKMDRLKSAMKTLVQQLRPFDKITLIYFSGDARIVLPTHYATDTAHIDSVISSIVTGGTTSANRALFRAHKTAMQEYILNANNQVILATDGIFSYDDNIVSLYKYDSLPIQFTIVGLAVDKESDKNLTVLAKNVHGGYVNMFKQQDANRVLLEEIKRRSALTGKRN